MKSLPVFETKRLRLRPYTELDFEFLRTLETDPEVIRYLGNGQIRTEEKTRNYFQKAHNDYKKCGLGLYGVELLESGKMIGRAGLIPWLFENQNNLQVIIWR